MKRMPIPQEREGQRENCFQTIHTMSERCRVCYTCVRECPAKAIRIIEGQAKVIHERCIGCGNCVRVCSQRAKVVVDSVPRVQELLERGDPVVAIIAPSFASDFQDYPYRDLVAAIHHLINETPEILKTVPHFTPVDKIDEVGANRNPQLSERLGPALPEVIPNRIDSGILRQSSVEEVRNKILEAHRQEARHHE